MSDLGRCCWATTIYTDLLCDSVAHSPEDRRKAGLPVAPCRGFWYRRLAAELSPLNGQIFPPGSVSRVPVPLSGGGV
ncbi:unnamed protein product [Lota lota]